MDGSFDFLLNEALRISPRFKEEFYKQRNEFHLKNKKYINQYKIINIKKNNKPYPNEPHVNPYGQYEVYRENGIKEIYACGSGIPLIGYYIKYS